MHLNAFNLIKKTTGTKWTNEQTNKQTSKKTKFSTRMSCKSKQNLKPRLAKCKETGPQTTQTTDYGSLAADSESVGPSLGTCFTILNPSVIWEWEWNETEKLKLLDRQNYGSRKPMLFHVWLLDWIDCGYEKIDGEKLQPHQMMGDDMPIITERPGSICSWKTRCLIWCRSSFK